KMRGFNTDTLCVIGLVEKFAERHLYITDKSKFKTELFISILYMNSQQISRSKNYVRHCLQARQVDELESFPERQKSRQRAATKLALKQGLTATQLIKDILNVIYDVSLLKTIRYS